MNLRFLVPAVLLVASVLPAGAHLTYRTPSGGDYGTFTGLTAQSGSISGINVNAFGWADGTDSDFANQHEQRYFRFTLQNSATVTISVTALDPANLKPGFSIYSGLGHTAPSDYDTSSISDQYLATLPNQPKEGAFNALATWKMGNDNGTTFADLSTFTYIGNAADGTSAIFGNAVGIFGDGLADGYVSRSWDLQPGSYTVVIGGANYFTQTDSANRGMTTTLGVVPLPEPSTAAFTVMGLLTAGGGLRRRTR